MAKKRIKIAVSIDETGQFGALPINDGNDQQEMLDISVGGLEGVCIRQYVIEAEVDVPVPEVVAVGADAVQDLGQEQRP